MQKFEDNSQVIVTRGSKNIAKDTEVTVLGYDGESDSYAVKYPVGENLTAIRNLKASALGPKPERAFTQSEIVAAFQDGVHAGYDHACVSALADRLGLRSEIAYPASAPAER